MTIDGWMSSILKWSAFGNDPSKIKKITHLHIFVQQVEPPTSAVSTSLSITFSIWIAISPIKLVQNLLPMSPPRLPWLSTV